MKDLISKIESSKFWLAKAKENGNAALVEFYELKVRLLESDIKEANSLANVPANDNDCHFMEVLNGYK